jgi:hypothetical protein
MSRDKDRYVDRIDDLREQNLEAKAKAKAAAEGKQRLEEHELAPDTPVEPASEPADDK